MPEPLLQLVLDERIATLTISNSPANALSGAVLDELERAVDRLCGSDDVRVIILTGSGRFFCPGADIKELGHLDASGKGAELSARGQHVLNRIEASEIPFLAAINGPCLGGGLELAMACHIRVAASGVPLGLPETKLGFIPGFGGTQRLPRIVGAAKAAELILTGEPVKAEEALAIGLVNRVVPAAELPAQARSLAKSISEKGRHAVRAALSAIRASLEMPLTQGLAREAELFGGLCETADKKEGVSAFLEKRAPRFE